jgi:hypothetical protein
MLYPINAIAMDDCKAGTCIVPVVNDASLIAGVVAEGLESPTSMPFWVWMILEEEILFPAISFLFLFVELCTCSKVAQSFLWLIP